MSLPKRNSANFAIIALGAFLAITLGGAGKVSSDVALFYTGMFQRNSFVQR